MKKILALVCFLLLALAGCATQPTGNKDTTSNANQPAETKSMAMPSEADIIAKEKGTWDAAKKKDWDAYGNMMANDFVEILDSGLQDKATAMASIKDFELSDVTYADWKMIPVDKDAAILLYSFTVKANYKGQPIPTGPYHGAAVWVNRNGQWQSAFYQETMTAKEPMPMPMPPTPAATKPAASPAKPGETGADPIANEKMVWDLFRNRNYDGFAALLAPEFMEVEETGVYDKAASVKGVQTFDATKSELSDWKSVKLDDHAALVTYTVTTKGAPVEKAYHATVWGDRSGKWLGLFHQGTPAAKPK
jgi:hypothetical protein